MLSSAGIGYFEYEAQADGPVSLGLDVKLGDVDDVLTSLVVFDSKGGVGAVELPGRNDQAGAFADLPFGPEALESVDGLLNGLQGVDVSVQGPRPMAGRIVHAQRFTETVLGGARARPASVEHVRLTLLADEGLLQCVVEDADSVQIADPVLRGRLARALEALRAQASRTVRHLTLRSDGSGARAIRAGFVVGAPLWKASYRLVLPAHPGEPARLQGWAVVENAGTTDWGGVALTLQYGNPVTFRQAIYGTYFVARPEVPVEVFGRILPDVDERARPGNALRPAAKGLRNPAGSAEDFIPAPPAVAAAPAPAMSLAAPAEPAQAEEQPEETSFSIAKPVSLAAGHTANVPIIDRTVPAERLDLLPANSTTPLSALRLTNDSGSSLPAGVLALYDLSGAASFAGNARLGGLPAGESRLLSFAQDLRTGAERELTTVRTVASVAASQGVLHVTYRDREIHRIVLTAPAHEARIVLVEVPRAGGATLTVEGEAREAREETATAWRIAVSLKPGEVRRLTAYRDLPSRSDVALLQDGDELGFVLEHEEALSPAARAALEHLMQLRQDEAAKRARVDRLTADIAAGGETEDRIRRNLMAVGSGESFHTQLTETLRATEARIGRATQQRDQAQAETDQAHATLEQAIQGLHL